MGRRFLTGLAAVAVMVACKSREAAPPAPEAKTAAPPAAEGPAPPKAAHPTQVFFGDTHLHTSFSFDAGLFGATTTPDDAYRFAKGEEVTASKGMKAKLAVPLDFLVVADHSENLGFFKRLSAGDPEVLANAKGRQWYEGFEKGGQATVDATLDLIKTFSQGRFPEELMMKGEAIRPLWEDIIGSAETHNDPGKFTAFIGYEWTSMPGSMNLHRVVVFKDGAEEAKQIVPFSALDSTDPEKLWAAMDAYESKTGGEVLAIAHNGNLSNGRMFALTTESGQPLDADYARTRAENEPLYEVTQIKGDGEAHPFLSPDDEFADFETWDRGNLDASIPKKKSDLAGEYAREALKSGLKLEGELGANPFKFGLIGSTDSHTGLATADDDTFFGKHSGVEPGPERAKHVVISGKAGAVWGWQQVASGYAAVWAHENTRASLFEAMERKETYATTGPRMTVRFFGGWDFTPKDLGDVAANGYARGVPMGGDLKPRGEAAAPTFIVAANKDANGANLDRIQIVKGWVDASGETREKVYDVVWSDDRKPGVDGKLPTVGNTVNVEACTYENTIGSAELAKVWTDPDFDPSERAFYYVRVLEIPTPRWTAYDVKRYGVELGDEVPMITQQRAYTSPIWYDS